MKDVLLKRHGTGLWILQSFINHACNSNAGRYYIGDICFVRAEKSIKQGEEITFQYVEKEINSKDNHLAAWKILKCDCSLC